MFPTHGYIAKELLLLLRNFSNIARYHQVRETYNRIQWSPQFMTHSCKELTFGTICSLCWYLGLDQAVLCLLYLGKVHKTFYQVFFI
ncbi:hypothetical protein SDC9_209711 [bioreactor metagenome]|uniref:Uncharacterized protein n=1 Tax=bioreactor metagenome TaxID=1076179 RepID=A0A645JE10_9ZZZZ